MSRLFLHMGEGPSLKAERHISTTGGRKKQPDSASQPWSGNTVRGMGGGGGTVVLVYRDEKQKHTENRKPSLLLRTAPSDSIH